MFYINQELVFLTGENYIRPSYLVAYFTKGICFGEKLRGF